MAQPSRTIQTYLDRILPDQQLRERLREIAERKMKLAMVVGASAGRSVTFSVAC
jgi:hypothetical protein